MSNFCKRPLGQIFVDADGSRRICCASRDKPSYEPIPVITEAGRAVHAEMVAGKRPEACSWCWGAEDAGVQSVRQSSDWIDLSHGTDFPFLYEFRLGRTCNIACKMCSTRFSTKWFEISSKRHLPLTVWKEIDKANYEWFADENIRNNIRNGVIESVIYHGAVEMLFHGGECFINKHLFKFLDTFPLPIKKKIRVSFITNGTTLPKNIHENLKDFNRVIVNVSIDGYGKVNDYIRWPSIYSEVESNLLTLKSFGYFVRVLSTVSSYNVIQFHEIAERCSEIGVNLSYDPVRYPVHLNIDNLPREIRNLGIQRAEESLCRGKLSDENRGQVEMMIGTMKAPLSGTYCQSILDFSSEVDSHTGLYLKDCIPELYDLLQRYK